MPRFRANWATAGRGKWLTDDRTSPILYESASSLMTFTHGQGALLLVGAVVLSTGTVSAQDAVQLEPITLYAGKDGAVIDGYRAVTTNSATKTETPLKETPQSVVVVTPQLLRDQGVTTIAEGLLMYMDMMPVGSVDLLTPSAWPKWTMPQGLAMTDGDATYTTAGGFAQLCNPRSESSISWAACGWPIWEWIRYRSIMPAPTRSTRRGSCPASAPSMT
ncbi:tonB-dependent siderophore receptor [Azospirillum sp. B510]|uniref:TonB-dependent siderophore receptor n=1 Tax=Azospirillum sp. (strain B510) TaxID=137722 RepID=UPI0001C4C2D9|nr:TonB-dependent siderophore receptor [Azospirillum sp. B510]BAI71441.1 tonB-dependent siderophore receptor [Azospirillum sp. B510]